MELKADKTTKILLGAIALGLFLNASDVIITKAFASTQSDISYCMDGAKITGTVIDGYLRAKITTYC
jgi:hypothetical protein